MSLPKNRAYEFCNLLINYSNLLVAALSLIGLIVGTIFAYQAMEAALVQANDATLTMRMTTRPWLMATYKLKTIIMGIKIDGDDKMGFRGRLAVNRVVKINNKGNTPALNVFLISRFYLEDQYTTFNSIDEEKTLCNEADKVAAKVGFAVFPTQNYKDLMEDDMLPKDFEKNLPSRSFTGMHIAYCIRYEYASFAKNAGFVGHTGFEVIVVPKPGVTTPLSLDGSTLNGDQFHVLGPNNIASYVD